MGNQPVGQLLLAIFDRLMARYGPQYWWPAQEPFEVIVGAVLTQSAAWVNVERAIARMRTAGVLSPQAIRAISESELARLIYPSGYYNTKAKKLKALALWLGVNYADDLDRLFDNEIGRLRCQLLDIYGIGPETADSIILYAADKPIFVIDAYTRRIIDRVGLTPASESYGSYQSLFMDNLPADVRLFNEYHALLVSLAKDACRKRPLCRQCCLNDICRYSLTNCLSTR